MKTTKLISILILLAILSFSCKEDDATDDGNNNNSLLAEKYMFKQNSVYLFDYEHEYETSYDYDEFNGEISFEIGGMTEYSNRNCLHVIADNTELYFNYTETSINIQFEFRYDDKLISKDWINFIDFTKDEWQSYRLDLSKNDKDEIEGYINIKGKKVKDITFEFEDKTYYGIEFELRRDVSTKKYTNGQFKEEIEGFEDRIVWVVEDLGIVKEDIYYKIDNLTTEFYQELTSKRILNTIF